MFYRFLALVLLILVPAVGCLKVGMRESQATKWESETYVENAQLQSKWADQFFFRHYRWIGDESVLDIGSGDGKLTARILSYTPRGRVVGLDKSPSMTEHAKKVYGLNILLRDAGLPETYLDLENQFNLVTSFSALHWVPQQLDALKGIHRALKKGGQAYLRLSSLGFDPVQSIADSMIHSKKWKRHFETFKDPMTRFSISGYRELLIKAGLKEVSIRETRDADLLANSDAMYRQIKSWLPHAKHLSENLEDIFLKEVVSTYVKKFGVNPDGSITLYDCYLEVIARKES